MFSGHDWGVGFGAGADVPLISSEELGEGVDEVPLTSSDDDVGVGVG